MSSYRAQLAKIGIQPGTPWSYQDFYSRPQSLRQAMHAMDAPASEDWSQVYDVHHHSYWTDEVSGVASDGSHWIFSTNANQGKPDVEDKSIYVFKIGGDQTSRIKYKDVPHPLAGIHESDDHWGQVTYYNGFVYVSHFWSGGPKKGVGNVVVFQNNDGFLVFNKWIELEKVKSSDDLNGAPRNVEFQAINPWDGQFYTCYGGGVVNEFFIHDIETGAYTGRTIKFDVPMSKVQGACFSSNGHLYVATNEYLPKNSKYQTIWYYSALNGHRLGVIPVLAEAKLPDQELEGICYANVGSAQIYAVLLENPDIELDDIFFKGFSSSKPDIV